jgi:AmmeMemoRadiSam system protein A
MNLSEDEKEKLKKLVRETIESVFLGRETELPEVSGKLKEKRGAFVTIKNKGQLRGCIGHIRGMTPLVTTIKEMAVQAAFHDPRFHPLGKEELEDIDIEISVLTPMKKITDINEIQVGVHGIYLEKGIHSGLLLPQVATEYNWDRITFLEHTCNKAGLPKDAYKTKDMNIYIFSADVF